MLIALGVANAACSLCVCVCARQLNTEWAQVEVVDLINDGSGLGFGIIGGRSTGVVVKTIVPGGVSDRVNHLLSFLIGSFIAAPP